MDGSFEDVQTVAVNGATLAYREHGDGEPVVFVHGTANDMRTWQYQLAPVGAAHRAIAYSRRHARPNEDIEPGADDQMLSHVEDLAAFLEAIDAVPAHLVGNSWGAFICLLEAIRRPELVRSLALEEPPVLTLFISNEPRPAEILSMLLKAPRTGLAILRFGLGTVEPAKKEFERDDDEQGMCRFGAGVIGKDRFEAMPEEFMQQLRENRSAMKAQLLGEGFPPLSDDDVRGVRTPTLLLTGEQSPTIFVRLTDRLEELLPNVRRAEIPGASHVMHFDSPQAVNREILDFVGPR